MRLGTNGELLILPTAAAALTIPLLLLLLVLLVLLVLLLLLFPPQTLLLFDMDEIDVDEDWLYMLDELAVDGAVWLFR